MDSEVEVPKPHGTGGVTEDPIPLYSGVWRSSIFGSSILVIILSSVLFLRERSDLDRGSVGMTGITEASWIVCWLVALLLSTLFLALLVLRRSRSQGQPFLWKSLQKILGGFGVRLLLGGIVGAALVMFMTPAIGASFWATSYGVALLTTRGLIPRIVSRMGYVVLPSGLASLAYSWSDGRHPLPLVGVPDHLESPMLEADLIMGACFGVIPVMYGVLFVRERGSNERGLP